MILSIVFSDAPASGKTIIISDSIVMIWNDFAFEKKNNGNDLNIFNLLLHLPTVFFVPLKT